MNYVDEAGTEYPFEAEYRKGRVYAEWVSKAYDAEILEGATWNGFAVPRFTREVAEQVVTDLLEADGLEEEDEYEWIGDEVVETHTETIDGDETVYEVRYGPDDEGFYHIGANAWCWYEITPEEEECPVEYERRRS